MNNSIFCRKQMFLYLLVFILAVPLGLVSLPKTIHAQDFSTIYNISNDSEHDDRFPDVYGDYVVW